jgi:transcription elongation factor GreA
MTMATNPGNQEIRLTRAGYEGLRDEFATLTTVSRAEIADRLRVARDHGGEFADNLELIDALADQEMLERRITTLETSLSSALVVDNPPRDGTIGIGTRVRLLGIDSGRNAEYDIVGSVEPDPFERRLSAESPVGRALLGRRAGDVLEVEAPGGQMRFRILAVSPGGRAAGRPSVRSRGARVGGVRRVERGARAAAH